jgi:histidine triad (HIT) family protein
MTYDPHNIFARILRGEIPCEPIYENEVAYAFRDIAPAASVHVLVICRRAAVSFDDFMQQAPAEEIAAFFASVRQVAFDLGLSETGYRLIANHGADATQTVPHFHVHVLGGEPLGGLLASDRKLR